MGQKISVDCFSTPNSTENNTILLHTHKQFGKPKGLNRPVIDSKQYESLKNQCAELKLQCAELQLQNDQLHQQVNQFTSQNKLHHTWDYTQICQWIMSLDDDIFLPYKNTLLKNIKQEQINGQDLCQLDINDLHRLGIKSAMHKKLLLYHLKSLTQFDKKPQYAFDSYLPHTINTPTNTSLRRISTRASQIDFSSIKLTTDRSDMDDTRTTNSNDMSFELSNGKWNYNNGVLFIKIIGMDFEVIMDYKCDIYIELELKGDYYQKELSKRINNKDGNSVFWNEKFQFFSDNAKEDILNIKILNKRKWKFDEKIGIVCVPIMDVLSCDGFIDKKYDIKESKNKYGGKLHIELKYKELLH